MGTNIMRSSGKGRSKTALRAGLPRNVKSMSKEVLEATLEKKRECNAKAQKIVESLLEKDIKEEWFVNNLKFISDTHFQDVIEERAITKMCGYPLCDSLLKNIPNQQYKICTTQNKVYDLTERKNFCSNHCYKASKYLKDQLLTSPLWLRDKEEIPEFKLLSASLSRGIVGDEVSFGQQESLRDEITQTKGSDSRKIGNTVTEPVVNAGIREPVYKELAETPNAISDKPSASTLNDGPCPGNSESTFNASVSVNECNEISTEKQLKSAVIVPLQNAEISDGLVTSHSNSQLDINFKLKSPTEERTFSGDDNICFSNKQRCIANRERKEKHGAHEELYDHKQGEAPLTTMHIEKCVREWFTLDSMYLLLGEETMREMVADKDVTHYYKPVESDSWDPGMRQRYIAICKKLNLMELEDISYDNKINEESKQMKPLPSYSTIKEEGTKIQLKVRAFYAGKTAYEDTPNEDGAENSEPVGNFLPLIDLHSKSALRRRIVLDRFNRILPDLLLTFGMSSRDISEDLRCLVSSFCLSAHNITFKPTEWNLLGLIVLKMLSFKDKRIKTVLDSDQARKYMTMMLMVFQEDAGYLDRLIEWLMDIDHLLQQHSSRSST